MLNQEAQGMGIQAVDRAVEILEVLARADRPKPLNEIAAALGLRATTTHNLVKTLKLRGYVDQEPSGSRYQLGFMCFRLGQGYARSRNLIDISRPILERLVEQTGESGVVAVLEQLRLFFTLLVNSHQLVSVDPAREAIPDPCSAATGKVLVAHLSAKDFENYLQLYGTPVDRSGHPVSVEAFRKDLAEIRRKGYAFRYDRAGDQARAVGAPIRDAEGRVVASIGVAAPKARFEGSQRRSIVAETARAASKVSWEMGYRPPEADAGESAATKTRSA